MQLQRTHLFHGPNRWSRLPVCEMLWIEMDHAAAQRLSKAIDQLHTMSGVVARSFEPRQTAPASYLMAFEFEEYLLLEECVKIAFKTLQAAPINTEIDLHSHRRHLVDLADDIRLGPSSRAILRAAAARGIPYFRLNKGSLVQFGEGAFQRRTWTAETDATSAIAESIASDKQLTRSLLEAVGVNVPQGRSVTSRTDAWKAALQVGLPVAVKPRNANHAVGVSLDLHDQQAVMDAYDWACQAGHTTDVLVEQFIEGDHHRLLVVGGKMVAAAKGQREFVYGDGSSTIRQLVDQLNADPRRGENYTDQLQVVKLDDNAAIQLRRQGLDFDSVPEQGREVLVWHVGDLIEDCTDLVHPSTKEIAILAARTIGLDIAGMDLVAKDISQPLDQQRGCIIEVNAGPSLTPHVQPLRGSARPVGEAVVELLYPNGRPSKVPTLIFLQAEEIDGAARRLALTLQKQGFHIGLSSHECQRVDSWPLERPLAQYRTLLMHPALTMAIIDVTSMQLAECGLLCQHVDIVVLGESTIHQSQNNQQLSDALKVITHLLEFGGRVITVGSTCSDSVDVANALGISPARLTSVACQNDLGELLQREFIPAS